MSLLSLIIIILGSIIAVILIVARPTYRSDIRAARKRSGSQVIETKCGPIEYATMGEGPPVLVVHGAGGGYDQGLWIARDSVGEGFHILLPLRALATCAHRFLKIPPRLPRQMHMHISLMHLI